MVELAAIGPGARVLDVASGVGEPAVTAARRAGPDGQVLATDHSAEMLGHGRKRAEKLGLDNIEFRGMDAQALEVPEAAFDAVLCRWGVMFLPDLDRALAGFRRCLKPGGRLVAAIWGPAERVPCVGLGARVVHAHLGLAPPDEGAGTPFALSEVAAFERRVAAAGFENVRGEWFNVSYVFETAAQFTQYRRDLSRPLNQRMAAFPAETREAAWAALTEAARRPFETPEGMVKTRQRRLLRFGACLKRRKDPGHGEPGPGFGFRWAVRGTTTRSTACASTSAIPSRATGTPIWCSTSTTSSNGSAPRTAAFRFRVAPADLVFHGVTDLKIAIDWGDSGDRTALHDLIDRRPSRGSRCRTRKVIRRASTTAGASRSTGPKAAPSVSAPQGFTPDPARRACAAGQATAAGRHARLGQGDAPRCREIPGCLRPPAGTERDRSGAVGRRPGPLCAALRARRRRCAAPA